MSTIKINKIGFCTSILLVMVFVGEVSSQNSEEITKTDSSEIFNKIRLRRSGTVILYRNDIISENEMYRLAELDNNLMLNQKVKKAKQNSTGQHVCFTGAMAGLALSTISLGVNYFLASFNLSNSSFDKEKWNPDLAAFSVGTLAVSCGFFIGLDSFKDTKRKQNKEIIEMYNQKF